MTKAELIQYFGDRGMHLNKKDFKEFGIVGRYIFIHFINGLYENRGYVEMYETGYSPLECQEEFEYLTFKFSKNYMRKCVTGEVSVGNLVSGIKFG